MNGSLRVRCLQPYLYLESPSYLFERSTDGGETWLPLEHPEAHNHIIEVRGEVRHDRSAKLMIRIKAFELRFTSDSILIGLLPIPGGRPT